MWLNKEFVIVIFITKLPMLLVAWREGNPSQHKIIVLIPIVILCAYILSNEYYKMGGGGVYSKYQRYIISWLYKLFKLTITSPCFAIVNRTMSWQANIAICLTTFYLKPANEKEITGVIAAHYLPGRPMGIVGRSNDIQDSHGRIVIGMNQCMDATVLLQRPVCLLYNMINSNNFIGMQVL